MDTKVNLALMMDDKTRKAWIRVQVFSNMKPTVHSQKDVDADSTNLEYDVSAAADLLCMHQEIHYGDVHNTTAVLKAAREALKEIQEQAARAGRGQG